MSVSSTNITRSSQVAPDQRSSAERRTRRPRPPPAPQASRALGGFRPVPRRHRRRQQHVSRPSTVGDVDRATLGQPFGTTGVLIELPAAHLRRHPNPFPSCSHISTLHSDRRRCNLSPAPGRSCRDPSRCRLHRDADQPRVSAACAVPRWLHDSWRGEGATTPPTQEGARLGALETDRRSDHVERTTGMPTLTLAR